MGTEIVPSGWLAPGVPIAMGAATAPANMPPASTTELVGAEVGASPGITVAPTQDTVTITAGPITIEMTRDASASPPKDGTPEEMD